MTTRSPLTLVIVVVMKKVIEIEITRMMVHEDNCVVHNFREQ